jgi:hypothetical protein
MPWDHSIERPEAGDRALKKPWTTVEGRAGADQFWAFNRQPATLPVPSLTSIMVFSAFARWRARMFLDERQGRLNNNRKTLAVIGGRLDNPKYVSGRPKTGPPLPPCRQTIREMSMRGARGLEPRGRGMTIFAAEAEDTYPSLLALLLLI